MNPKSNTFTWRLYFLFINAFFLVSSLHAQQPVLVKDINPNGHTAITHMTKFNGMMYFSAEDYTNGIEMWVSDGTTNGTQLFKDINPGSNSGNPSSQATFFSGDAPFTEIGGHLYFRAYDTANGGEPWMTDGTAANTLMIKDIIPGNVGSIPYDFIDCNGRVYFIANDNVHGSELWATDGTSAGTSMVKDTWINPNFPNHQSGIGDFFVQEVTNAGASHDFLFFRAYNDTAGSELWFADSAHNNVTLFMDINPGSASSVPSNPISFNNKTFFSADNDTNGIELWVTDGTLAGTYLFKDINAGTADSKPNDFVVYNGKLYFTADDGINGRELWVTDGTSAGTHLFKDINPNIGSAFNSPDRVEYIEYNGKLYFVCDDGTHGLELCSTDGSIANTAMVIDIAQPSAWVIHSSPANFVICNGLLYFDADDQTINGRQLWETNGTAAGTQQILPPSGAQNTGSPNVKLLAEHNGAVYFTAQYEINGEGNELWKYEVQQINCLEPSNIAAKNVSATTAEIEWVENGGTNLWEIEYGLAGFQQGNGMIKTVYDTTGNSSTLLDSLLPNTSYEVYVRSHCYDVSTYSDWVGPEMFSTQSFSIDQFYQNELKFYPNPAQFGQDLSVEVPNAKNATATLYNTVGQLVFQKELQFDSGVAHLPISERTLGRTGVYFLHLQTTSGKTFVKKIVIEQK